jgi:thioredoxin-like negative regulator of GroEL
MNAADREVQQLHREVEADPSDAFLRCSLAFLLAAQDDYRGALAQLGVAMDIADGAMAAGCVAAAIRQVTDDFARLWQLPSGTSHLELVS